MLLIPILYNSITVPGTIPILYSTKVAAVTSKKKMTVAVVLTNMSRWIGTYDDVRCYYIPVVINSIYRIYINKYK